MDLATTILCSGTTLADGSKTGGRVLSLRINGVAVIQESKPLRADYISIFGRGNKRNDLEFKILTEYADQVDSLGAAGNARENIPDQADCVISLTLGGKSVTLTMPGAGWPTVNPNASQGCSVETDYTVVAGRIFVTATGSVSPGLFALPLLTEALIDPFLIPSGCVGTVPAGKLFVARNLQIDGALQIDSEAYLIGTEAA